MIRVLLYEDNRSFREALAEALAYSTEISLVDSFEDAKQAVVQVQKHKPDVVLMDIEMPGISGLEALLQIKDDSPNTKVMIQTQFEDNDSLFVALCRGAWGYVLKTDSFEKFEQAIIDVHKGGSYFSPIIAGKVRDFFMDREIKKTTQYDSLSEKELSLLDYLVKGLTNKQIGAEMFLSPQTIKSQLSSIYTKMHVTSRTQAVIKAIEAKLINKNRRSGS